MMSTPDILAPDQKTSGFDPAPCLYSGLVTHQRKGAVHHALRYKVTSVLLPLHRMEEADRASRLFSVNRFNLVSFHEADHMDRGYPSLTGFVADMLRQSGQFAPEEPLPNRITLLAFPRVMGHAFNPLSIFFCCDEQGALQAILYQVRNTFGERHHYLYRLEPKTDATTGRGRLHHEGEKIFYVSPFLDMKGKYDFSISLPDKTLSYTIVMSGDQPSSLTASFVAKRLPISASSLLMVTGKLWQSGWKILTAIHFEALKLWVKGAPYHKRPPKPSHPVSNLTRQTVGKGMS